MSDSNSIIVPFGKYKGQPMEVLLSDTSYITYQKQQPGFMKWLEENHVTIYNIFTTGAQQVQDTPEHNRLQARFLDKKFQLAFFDVINGYTVREHFLKRVKSKQKDIDSSTLEIANCNDKLPLAKTSLNENIQLAIAKLQTDINTSTDIKSYIIEHKRSAINHLRSGNIDIFSWDYGIAKSLKELNDKIENLNHAIRASNRAIDTAKQYLSIYQSIAADPLILKTEVTFEHGYDVHIKFQKYSARFEVGDYEDDFIEYVTIRTEVKPSVGDNYPAVLRQMRINQKESDAIDALLIGKFESESIDIDQLRGIFGRYKVVLLSEIEEKLASYT
jgi:hypothetical protein